ncbi:hypothetical protein ACIQBJ_13305 [Kitasatospora sp. NPDC088391]|uniref:hypothetical protein n=1 Tax=Kitasatospora sp. NPDC088391 TaxID=3364074 RepID=UPI00382E1BBB
MTNRPRTPALLGRALALALALLVLPAPGAGATDTGPAVVVNGTLSAPTVPAGQDWGGRADDWGGATLLVSAARAGHPQGFQAVALAAPASAPITTRVRGVRAGATVTVEWDDNPDSCVGSGGGRPYTVSVAGGGNSAGSYTTNAANSKANWGLGRSYSFTAAEDAPTVTFTFGTPAVSPGCRPMVTDVRAAQTPPPAPATPPKADPCAGGGGDAPACGTAAGNQQAIDHCPATSRDCLAGVAGKGEQENAGIGQQTQALDEFTHTPRDQDPNAALGGLCAVSGAHTGNLEPGDTVLAPGTWWYC